MRGPLAVVPRCPGVGYRQRAVEVRDEVVRVLYAGRVPHERLGDAHLLALLGARLDVARGRGGSHSGLDGPEVGRAVRELEARQKLPYRVVPPHEREAQHPAEATHLPAGELVLGVGLEARVEDTFYRRVRLQKACQLQGVLVVAAYPQLEGLKAAEQQVGGEGIEGGAVDLAVVVHPPHELSRAADDPAQGVRMTPEVLGGAVEHKIRPEGERALVYRCCEGAIHHDDRPGLMPGPGEPYYVDQF